MLLWACDGFRCFSLWDWASGWVPGHLDLHSCSVRAAQHLAPRRQANNFFIHAHTHVPRTRAHGQAARD